MWCYSVSISALGKVKIYLTKVGNQSYDLWNATPMPLLTEYEVKYMIFRSGLISTYYLGVLYSGKSTFQAKANVER